MTQFSRSFTFCDTKLGMAERVGVSRKKRRQRRRVAKSPQEPIIRPFGDFIKSKPLYIPPDSNENTFSGKFSRSSALSARSAAYRQTARMPVMAPALSYRGSPSLGQVHEDYIETEVVKVNEQIGVPAPEGHKYDREEIYSGKVLEQDRRQALELQRQGCFSRFFSFFF